MPIFLSNTAQQNENYYKSIVKSLEQHSVTEFAASTSLTERYRWIVSRYSLTTFLFLSWGAWLSVLLAMTLRLLDQSPYVESAHVFMILAIYFTLLQWWDYINAHVWQTTRSILWGFMVFGASHLIIRIWHIPIESAYLGVAWSIFLIFTDGLYQLNRHAYLSKKSHEEKLRKEQYITRLKNDEIEFCTTSDRLGDLKQALYDLLQTDCVAAGTLLYESHQRSNFSSESLLIWYKQFNQQGKPEYTLAHIYRSEDNQSWQLCEIADIPNVRASKSYDHVPNDQELHSFNHQFRVGEKFLRRQADKDEEQTYRVCHEGWNGLRSERQRRQVYPIDAQIAAMPYEGSNSIYEVGGYNDFFRYRQDMRAIMTSATWGELFDNLPSETIEELTRHFVEPLHDNDEPPGLPERDELFQMWDFPGFEEGVYPQLWTCERNVLPNSILRKYFKDSMGNELGLEEEELFEFAADMEDRGFYLHSWGTRY